MSTAKPMGIYRISIQGKQCRILTCRGIPCGNLDAKLVKAPSTKSHSKGG